MCDRQYGVYGIKEDRPYGGSGIRGERQYGVYGIKEARQYGGSRIKLCGLWRDCDITWANELGPDYVGFVFARGSRRYVTPEKAKELRRQLRPGILPVGVFAGEVPERILALLEQGTIEVVQLHGREDALYIRQLRKKAKAKIWQAFSVSGQEDIERANASEADLVLLDSGGGSGRTFDWSLLGEIKRPWFLAGGLTPENVGEAIRRLHPFGVDASSCLEENGFKDRKRMAAFVEAVREIEARESVAQGIGARESVAQGIEARESEV